MPKFVYYFFRFNTHLILMNFKIRTGFHKDKSVIICRDWKNKNTQQQQQQQQQHNIIISYW